MRKGEFWQCPQCTLKNSLASGICSACKSVRALPIDIDISRGAGGIGGVVGGDRVMLTTTVIPEGNSFYVLQ